MARRKGTRTSKFGSSKRESHDSSRFYSGKLYDSVQREASAGGNDGPECVRPLPPAIIDRVLCQDSRSLSNIPDSSIHLMVTSPPYNVGKEYDRDLDLEEYLTLLRDVFAETHRALVDGGRVCINIANVGRKPYIPYHKHIIDQMQDVGFLMRGEVIWDKGPGAGTSTAWGSWCSPSNPTLRDTHEYILVFSKGSFSRKVKGKRSTIAKNEFLESTKSVWRFSPESASKVRHPAPFPVELPRRCIQLFTFEGENVLDPFCGVGSTCIAALDTGRHFVGIDIEPAYVKLATERIRRLYPRLLWSSG
jgi:site-specific DNA-methyltransferase (adenine-specific)